MASVCVTRLISLADRSTYHTEVATVTDNNKKADMSVPMVSYHEAGEKCFVS